MSLVTHVFHTQQRVQDGRIVTSDPVMRRANFEYDITGNNVVISINPSLSSKRTRSVRQDRYILYYQGEDSDYRLY